MERAEIYLNVMVCVLWADGVAEPREEDLLFQMMESMGLRPELLDKYRRLCQGGSLLVDIDALIEESVQEADSDTLAWVIQDAYMLAEADGPINRRSAEVIDRILLAAGLPRTRLPAIHEWAHRGVEHARQGEVLFENPLPPLEVTGKRGPTR